MLLKIKMYDPPKETFDDISNRHLLIDSSFLGVEGTANLITEMVKTKFGV